MPMASAGQQAIRQRAPRSETGASMTNKEFVLSKYPKAYVIYAGLSLKFVIINDARGPEISGHRVRVSDAWRSAAWLIRHPVTTGA